ncbi:MAG: hypothetical protein ACJAZS_000820 [Alteromonas naphthalenivorans]|jgi:hypothetical protein
MNIVYLIFLLYSFSPFNTLLAKSDLSIQEFDENQENALQAVVNYFAESDASDSDPERLNTSEYELENRQTSPSPITGQRADSPEPRSAEELLALPENSLITDSEHTKILFYNMNREDYYNDRRNKSFILGGIAGVLLPTPSFSSLTLSYAGLLTLIYSYKQYRIKYSKIKELQVETSYSSKTEYISVYGQHEGTLDIASSGLLFFLLGRSARRFTVSTLQENNVSLTFLQESLYTPLGK